MLDLIVNIFLISFQRRLNLRNFQEQKIFLLFHLLHFKIKPTSFYEVITS